MADQKPVDHQPQFFRVLMPGFSTKLGIPLGFVKYIKSERLETATILSPLGMPWRIKVEGDIPSLYFGEGWSEFVRFHDLQLGYFMVFHYLGRMVFSLHVFDLSCCKKEYYHNKPGVGGSDVKSKKIKREEENPNPEIVGNSKCHPDGQRTPGTTGSCTPRFHYTVGSSLNQIKTIRVPSAFTATTDIKTKHEVFLRDQEKRLFPVHLLHTTNNRTLFRKGWREFYLGNNLKAGDVCKFQYSTDSNEENIIQVDILKQSTRPSTASRYLHCHTLCQKERPRLNPDLTDSNEKKKSKASNPSTHLQRQKSTKRTTSCTGRFRITVTRPYVNKPFMNIPVAFIEAASSIFSLQQVILEDPEGVLFPVRIHQLTRFPRQRIFTTGWKEFYVSNNLKLGNTLEFQYSTDSKEENNTMKVLIFKKSTICRQPAADSKEKKNRNSENPSMKSRRQKSTKKHLMHLKHGTQWQREEELVARDDSDSP